jgi:hypothetical protein
MMDEADGKPGHVALQFGHRYAFAGVRTAFLSHPNPPRTVILSRPTRRVELCPAMNDASKFTPEGWWKIAQDKRSAVLGMRTKSSFSPVGAQRNTKLSIQFIRSERVKDLHFLSFPSTQPRAIFRNTQHHKGEHHENLPGK